MNTAFRIIAVTLLVLCAAGCASQQQENANQSTIPWNRPQSWEGGGMLGGYNPGAQGSTGH